MQIITPFDPSITTSGTIKIALVNKCAVVYLINESAIGLKLTFQDGSTGVLPPQYTRAFKLSIPGLITWSQWYTLGTSTAPLSVVQGEGYEPSEVDISQLSQGPLMRQTNIGNTVNTMGTVTNLVNDGNGSGTNIIESTVSGSGATNVSFDNSGNVTIAEYVAAVRTVLMQIIAGSTPAIKLGNTGRAVEILSTLLVDSSITSTIGNITTGQGDLVMSNANSAGGHLTCNGVNIIDSSGFDLFIKPRGSTNIIHFVINSIDILTIASGGITASNGVNFNIGRIKDINTFTGTGSGTFNHGLSGVPADCWVTTNLNGSTQTVGVSNFTSTTVKIDTGSGLAWRATAYR